MVLAAGGVGLWVAKNGVIDEAAQALHVVAIAGHGAGHRLRPLGARAYALSRQLGLLDPSRANPCVT